MSNTATRILVAVVAIPIIGWIIFQGGWWFFGFIQLLILLGLHELYAMFVHKNVTPNLPVGMAAGVAIGLLFFHGYPGVQIAAQFFPLSALLFGCVLLTLSVELWRAKPNPLLNGAATIFGVLYIALFFGSLIGVRNLFFAPWIKIPALENFSLAEHQATAQQWGAILVFLMFIAIWVCDSAAFFVGKAIGKHKILPRVSPGKSWEGGISGFFFSAALFPVLTHFFLPVIPVVHSIILGALIGSVGQLGDFAKSLLKRDVGIKDSSNLIPGHGGIIDRFDSILFVAPVVYIYLGILFSL